MHSALVPSAVPNIFNSMSISNPDRSPVLENETVEELLTYSDELLEIKYPCNVKFVCEDYRLVCVLDDVIEIQLQVVR